MPINFLIARPSFWDGVFIMFATQRRRETPYKRRRTLDISEEITARLWLAPGPPDLVALRPAIENRFAALLKRKRQPHPRKKPPSP